MPFLVHASISSSGKVWHPKLVTIDFAAGPNIIDILLLNDDWNENIQKCQHPRYTGASGHCIRFHGVISFYVEFIDFRTRIWFGVVEKLPPKIILGNAFKSRFVKSIKPKSNVIRHFNSRPVPILPSNMEYVSPISISQPLEYTLRNHSSISQVNAEIRMSHSYTLAPNTQRFVKVQTSVSGIISIDPRP